MRTFATELGKHFELSSNTKRIYIIMKRRNSLLVCAILVAQTLLASPQIVCDFENYAIGDKVSLWNFYGGTSSVKGTIVADPANANNKVLHLVVKEWNTYAEFSLPQGITASSIGKEYTKICFRMQRANADEGDYKHMAIFLGSEALYEDDGWPHQGNKGVWQQREYQLMVPAATNNSTLLHLGINSDNVDYYLDDIQLVGVYDDFTTVESGLVDFARANTSSDYYTYSTPTYIPAGKSLDMRTARYTYITAPFAGAGTLNIYGGGERTFISADKNSGWPDWSLFSGETHVYPYNKVVTNAGFYGLVLPHKGKVFGADEADPEKTNPLFADKRLVIHNGATLAAESGTRGFRIGELQLEKGSRLLGYYKASTHQSYFMVGALNTDATLAGRIAPVDNNGSPHTAQAVGIIKEGTGTYRITGNDNRITGAIRVKEGRVLINNDAAEAERSRLSGGTGAMHNTADMVAHVFSKGILGGTGNIGGSVNLYGTLQAGDDGIGSLQLRNFAASTPASLVLRPTAKIEMQIQSTDLHDFIFVNNDLILNPIGEDFSTSDDLPTLVLQLTKDSDVNLNDRFVLLTAAKKNSTDGREWTFRLKMPERYTWETEESTDESGRYVLAVKVVSLDTPQPGGEGDNDDDDDDDFNVDDDEGIDESTDLHSLAYYAQLCGKQIGIAVPAWNMDMTNDNQAALQTVAKDFNTVVAENCMKFESIQPSQGSFDFYKPDQLVSFAQRHKLAVRGHTLAWHSQVAPWVSSDGKKNDKNWTRTQLLQILEKHITTVVSHFKGKIAEWDVVNECLDDNQTSIRNNPNAYDLRKESVWAKVIGEDFIDSAFVYAHRADPNARLILNEYGGEFKGNAKSEALYNLAKRLKESNIPIHGVGLQCHFDVGEVNGKKISENIRRYQELGLDCIITELDIAIASAKTDEAFAQQAKDYKRVCMAMLANANCPTLMVWGITDNASWRQPGAPLLYDSSLNRKPAWYSVRSAFRKAAEEIQLSIDTPSDGNASARIIQQDYYSLTGIRLHRAPQSLMPYILRTTYSDGSVSVKKIMVPRP